MSLSDYRKLIADLVPDGTGKVSLEATVRAIEAARIRYSGDKPRCVVEDVTAAGGNDLPLPTAWSADVSRVLAVESPVGAMPPTFVSQEDWLVLAVPGGQALRVRYALAAQAVARITFSAPHVLTESADSIPLLDREAVVCWAASLLCDQLAASYATNSDATIQADRVDHTSPSRTWSKQAGIYRQRYFDLLGIDPKLVVAAGAVVNLDMSDSRGRPRQTHWRDR